MYCKNIITKPPPFWAIAYKRKFITLYRPATDLEGFRFIGRIVYSFYFTRFVLLL